MKKILFSSLIASSILFIGCSNKKNSDNTAVYKGKVDLAPMYKMIVYTGKWDGNESKLPTNYTFTDANGTYSLTSTKDETIYIKPISLTKVISTKESFENPIAFGNNFLDKTFEAYTKNTNAFIYASSERMDILNKASSNQLQTYYKVNSINELKEKIESNNLEVLRYKEIRDIQNYIFKRLLLSINHNTNNKDISKNAQIALTTSIIENNLSINDANDIKNLALASLSLYNNLSNPEYQITGNKKTELANYYSIITKPIIDSILSESNTTKINRLFGKIVDSEFTAQIDATANTIDTNITEAENSEDNNKLLYNALIQKYMQ